MQVVPLPPQPWWTDPVWVEMLQLHNHYRDRHCVAPLQWSEQLAQRAQQAVDPCPKGHSPWGKSNGGENVARGHANPQDVMNSWYVVEEKLYNYNSPPAQMQPSTGHFTQVIWANTREIGCARKVCVGTYWFCHYDPPGNYPDQFAQNVPRPCKP